MAAPLNPGDPLYCQMRELARRIFDHALAECSIPRAMQRHLELDDDRLRIGSDLYHLDSFSNINVVSIGKAGHSLAQALTEITDGGLHGIISCTSAPAAQIFGFRYFIGGDPMPNQESFRAAEAILKLISNSGPDALTIFLISGGASAIAEKPISPAITLEDVIATYTALLHSGASISEINTIRKHLSALKGGRMAQVAAPSHQISIMVSDVPEDALDALASGPTMPDTTTAADCYSIVEKRRLLAQFPASVRRLFERRQLQETPKPGDAAFAHSRYITILSNATALKAAVEKAALGGFAVEVDNSCDGWHYADAADHLLSRLRLLRQGASRVCLISGGELAAKVGKTPGTGGRNQQFAMYCAAKIEGQAITVLSAGTDGTDGNSLAAGAIADGSTVARARQKSLDPGTALKKLDYPLFEALGDAVITGPTGNNVRDVRVLLAY